MGGVAQYVNDSLISYGYRVSVNPIEVRVLKRERRGCGRINRCEKLDSYFRIYVTEYVRRSGFVTCEGMSVGAWSVHVGRRERTKEKERELGGRRVGCRWRP